MPIDPSLVSHGPFQVDEGIGVGRRLLARPDRPTAIITGNDLQALGVYQAAREAKLHIPEDLSVVGFDDLPIARWVSPPLTTIRQPLIEMAEAAAELVVGLARGEEPPQMRVELATELVVRESTAPPAARRAPDAAVVGGLRGSTRAQAHRRRPSHAECARSRACRGRRPRSAGTVERRLSRGLHGRADAGQREPRLRDNPHCARHPIALYSAHAIRARHLPDARRRSLGGGWLRGGSDRSA